jgi:ubiquinone/menaquinone biosynthesis C-methylase UbiE
MIERVRAAFARSTLFSFNQVLRDRWVRAQARSVPPGSAVLDLGAGSAPYRADFAHCDYRTHDFARLDPDQLLHGGYGKIDIVADATAIPEPDASFDVVLCTEVLEHVPEPMRVIGEIARLLRPGGRLILTAPLGSGIHQQPFHFYGGYTPWWYQHFLPAAGFGQVRIEPNAGSARFFSQEAIRFLRTQRPFTRPLPTALQIAWLPVWCLLLPVLGIIVPVACAAIDRFESEPLFTVGYHVTAIRDATPTR